MCVNSPFFRQTPGRFYGVDVSTFVVKYFEAVWAPFLTSRAAQHTHQINIAGKNLI